MWHLDHLLRVLHEVDTLRLRFLFPGFDDPNEISRLFCSTDRFYHHILYQDDLYYTLTKWDPFKFPNIFEVELLDWGMTTQLNETLIDCFGGRRSFKQSTLKTGAKMTWTRSKGAKKTNLANLATDL